MINSRRTILSQKKTKQNKTLKNNFHVKFWVIIIFRKINVVVIKNYGNIHSAIFNNIAAELFADVFTTRSLNYRELTHYVGVYIGLQRSSLTHRHIGIYNLGFLSLPLNSLIKRPTTHVFMWCAYRFTVALTSWLDPLLLLNLCLIWISYIYSNSSFTRVCTFDIMRNYRFSNRYIYTNM